MSSNFILLFFKIVLAIQGSLQFHVTMKIFLHFFEKLYVGLGGVDILTMLGLPIHEDGMSFHLFRYSLISFSNLLYFQHTYLLGYIYSKCLILSDAIVNGI